MEELLELFRDKDESSPFLTITNARSETVNGEEYVVAEAIILREGILNGSEGPYFYPEEEIVKRVGIWNGVIISAPHPYVLNEKGEKKFVSIDQTREVHNRFAVGTIYNDRVEEIDGKKVRKVDLYVNVKKADMVDSRIVPTMRSGSAIDVSTGIYTDRKKIDNAEWNGKKYTHSVHNISPDHLAILMDERGACSVRDGCGINVNTFTVNVIKKLPDGKYRLYSKDGKNLGTFDTLSEAEKRERQVEYFKQVNNTEESVLFPTLIEPVLNAWTQAARAASLAARRRSRSALGRDKKGKGKSRIRRAADSAISHHTVGDFKKVHGAHAAAVRGHNKAAKAARKRGDHRAASAHSDAAAAHKAAMNQYSKRRTNNSTSLPKDSFISDLPSRPKTCPECGGSMDSNGNCPNQQLGGKRTKCGYESDPVVNCSCTGGTMNEKEKLVSWLVTNCDCWKKQGSDTVLNSMDLDQLKTLKTNAMKATFTDVSTGIVKKIAAHTGFDPKKDKEGYNGLPDFVANAMGKDDDDDDYDDDDDDETVNNADEGFEDFTPKKGKGKPKKAVANKGQNQTQETIMNKQGVETAVKDVFKNMTVEQWKEWAPEPVRDMLANAEKVTVERKVAIINALTKNIQNPEARKAEILALNKKKLPELEEIAKYAGVNGAGQPVANAGESEDEKFLRFFNLSTKGGAAANGNGGGSVNNSSNGSTDDGTIRIGNMVLNTKDVLTPHMGTEDILDDE